MKTEPHVWVVEVQDALTLKWNPWNAGFRLKATTAKYCRDCRDQHRRDKFRIRKYVRQP